MSNCELVASRNYPKITTSLSTIISLKPKELGEPRYGRAEWFRSGHKRAANVRKSNPNWILGKGKETLSMFWENGVRNKVVSGLGRTDQEPSGKITVLVLKRAVRSL